MDNQEGSFAMLKLLSADDAANFLNLSASTLAKMRLSGKSPKYIKMGRRVAYRMTDLESWIDAQSFRSTSEYAGSNAE